MMLLYLGNLLRATRKDSCSSEGTLWVYKNAPWYVYIAILSITGCSAGLAEKYKNSDAIQNTDYGIDNTLHKFYDAKIFEIWR